VRGWKLSPQTCGRMHSDRYRCRSQWECELLAAPASRPHLICIYEPVGQQVQRLRLQQVYCGIEWRWWWRCKHHQPIWWEVPAGDRLIAERLSAERLIADKRLIADRIFRTWLIAERLIADNLADSLCGQNCGTAHCGQALTLQPKGLRFESLPVHDFFSLPWGRR